MKNKKIWIIAGSAAALVLVGGGVAFAATDGFEQDDALTGSSLDRASEAALAEVGEGTVTDAERSDDADHAYSVEVRLENGTEVDVDLDEDFAVVRTDRDGAATPSTSPTPSDDSTSKALTQQEIDEASAAALAEVGSGTVTDVDRSDDADHAFEVEVTLDDGSDVDVELDDAFVVVHVDDDSQR